MEPLLLHAGWVTKRKSGLLSSAPRRMFARLTLGLSPAHPAQFSCYESEAPSAARIKHASCDSTVALKADPATLQLPVRTRPNAAHALSALQSLTTGGGSGGSGGSSVGAPGGANASLAPSAPPSAAPSVQQAFVGIHWVFDIPSAVELRAWSDAIEQVQMQCHCLRRGGRR